MKSEDGYMSLNGIVRKTYGSNYSMDDISMSFPRQFNSSYHNNRLRQLCIFFHQYVSKTSPDLSYDRN